MVDTPDQITVQFDGDGDGTSELAWGQRENYAAIVRQNTWIPLGGVRPLPCGTTIEDITGELRYIMSRYQPMRTRLRFEPSGHVTQVVSRSGEITLDIFDAGDADPEQVATEVSDRYRAIDMDFANDWPVRMAAIRQRGVLTHAVLLMTHFVTDFAGAVVMMTEVAMRERAPITGMQPLEQAAWQRSPSGRRQNDAALRHWEAILRTIDPCRFAYPEDKREPRYWVGEFTSPSMSSALGALGDRTGAEPSAVALTVFALAMARTTGINPVVVRPMVSNRFRHGLAGVVSTVAQAGLCVLDVKDAPFDDAVRRVARAAMTAYKYAYFDPDDMATLRARIAEERGCDLDIGCFFNDRRGAGGPSASEPVPTPERIREALPHTGFRWIASQDSPASEPLFVHIEDTPGPIRIMIQLDTHCMAPDDGEALLRAMEAVAVSAALQ
jgi:hypothetical protein